MCRWISCKLVCKTYVTPCLPNDKHWSPESSPWWPAILSVQECNPTIRFCQTRSDSWQLDTFYRIRTDIHGTRHQMNCKTKTSMPNVYVWLDMVVYSPVVCKNNGLLECIAVNRHQPGEHDWKPAATTTNMIMLLMIMMWCCCCCCCRKVPAGFIFR